MKKGLVAILVLIISLFLITDVKAEESKTIIIELPSNEIGYIQYLSNINLGPYLLFNYCISQVYIGDNGIIQNQNGKEIIMNHFNEENMLLSFELLEGVSEEDLLFDINDDVISYFANGSIVDEYLSKYDKIQIIVKEFDVEPLGEVLVLDYSNDFSYDNSSLSSFFVIGSMFFDWAFNNFCNYIRLYDANDKILASFYAHFDNEGFINDVIFHKVEKIVIPEDITSEDDIIFELTNNDKSRLKSSYSLNVDDYARVIFKFSDAEYNNTDDYVFDIRLLDEQNIYVFNDAITYFTHEYNVFKDAVKDTFIDNPDNVNVMRIEIIEGLLFYRTYVLDGISYLDNYEIKLTDEAKTSMENELGYAPNSVIIKLGNPEFVEGNLQKFNINSEDLLSFQLNIQYEKFLETGEVFMDDMLVDRNNYEVSGENVIITFKKEFLDSLSDGEHNIRVTVIDGKVEASFTITNTIVNPKTLNNIMMCITMFMISIFGLFFLRKKEDYS